MKSPSKKLENTDELPVLSEEAIPKLSASEAGSEVERLATAIAALHDAIARSEGRWASLEARLEAHSQAVLELSQALTAATDRAREPSQNESSAAAEPGDRSSD